MKELIKFIGALGLCAVSFFWGLFTFVKCWALIAVPMGAPRIDQWKAYGIMILVHHLIYPMMYGYAKKEIAKEGPMALYKWSGSAIGAGAMSWFLAWLIFG